MDLSLFLGKIVGLYLVLVGVALLWNREFFLAAAMEAVKSKAIMLIGGSVAFVIGALMVFSHNVWSTDWAVLVTIFGWVALLKGVVLFLFPSHMIKHVKTMSEGWCLHVSGVVMFLAGLYLLYSTFGGV